MAIYVVAGASRGLGLEFVKQILARGDIAVGLVRNKVTSTGLTSIPNPNLHIVVADITKPASLAAAAAETATLTGGAIDVLINNAAFQDQAHGYHDITQFESSDALIKNLNDSWNTNVLGPILTTDAFLPLLRKGTLKKVLTLNTGLADVKFNLDTEWEGQAGYCISKNALDMAIVKFANALKPEGFTFLQISPGVVATAEEPPTPEVAAGIQKMSAKFAKVAPRFSGPITTEQSVGFIMPILDRWTPADSGKFVSHLGSREWL